MDKEGIGVDDLVVTRSGFYTAQLDAGQLGAGLSTEGARMIVELADEDGDGTTTCDGEIVVLGMDDGFVGGEEETQGGSTDDVSQDHGFVFRVCGDGWMTIEDSGR